VSIRVRGLHLVSLKSENPGAQVYLPGFVAPGKFRQKGHRSRSPATISRTKLQRSLRKAQQFCESAPGLGMKIEETVVEVQYYVLIIRTNYDSPTVVIFLPKLVFYHPQSPSQFLRNETTEVSGSQHQKNGLANWLVNIAMFFHGEGRRQG